MEGVRDLDHISVVRYKLNTGSDQLPSSHSFPSQELRPVAAMIGEKCPVMTSGAKCKASSISVKNQSGADQTCQKLVFEGTLNSITHFTHGHPLLYTVHTLTTKKWKDGHLLATPSKMQMETPPLVGVGGSPRISTKGRSRLQGHSIGHTVVFREYFIKLFWRILARFSPQDDDFNISQILSTQKQRSSDRCVFMIHI